MVERVIDNYWRPNEWTGAYFLGSSFSSEKGLSSLTVIDFDTDYKPTNLYTHVKKDRWQYQHDFLKEYNLKNLSPSSLANFVKILGSDQAMAKKFTDNMVRRSFEP